MKPLKFLLVSAALAFFAGCQTTSNGGPCDGFKAIRPTKSDIAVISDSLVHQIEAHNSFGEVVCKWRPK